MMRYFQFVRPAQSRIQREARPALEGLEGRILLYSTTGALWGKPARVTYSFVPDGTSVGGVSSNFQATMNAKFVTKDWQKQFDMAFAAWQKMANVNFVKVNDNGAPIGSLGN